MRITRKLAAVGVAGAVGLAGVGVGVVAAPLAVAAGATDGAQAPAADRLAERVQAVRDALAGLVGDGSITQAQAEEVATTLGGSEALRGGPGGPGGPGGHGGGRGLGGPPALDAAAEALGLTTDELRTALAEEGTSLADVAEAEGVEVQALVDALAAAASAHLDEEVAEGDLTQERADEIQAQLPERIAEAVERERGPGGRGEPGSGGGTTERSSTT
jgi:predicted trehalose synthase